MKKILFIIAMLSTMVSAIAQNDTIYGKSSRYYCPKWYDTILDTFNYHGFYIRGERARPLVYAKEDQVVNNLLKFDFDGQMAIKGIAVYSTRNVEGYAQAEGRYSLDTIWLPEYASLWQAFQPDILSRLDSVQWNDKTPKVVMLPCTAVPRSVGGLRYVDTTYMVESYEAYFDEPILVDTTFYISTTANNNYNFSLNSDAFLPGILTMTIGVVHDGLRPYPVESGVGRGWWCNGEGFYDSWLGNMFGGMFPIVDFYDIRVEANDSLWGKVNGGGRFSDLTYHTITAIPAPGNYFIQWSDGCLDNPRQVYVTQDSLFTAIFDTAQWEYEVVARPNDPDLGVVTGGGTYLLGDTAVLSATPNVGYGFAFWNDGDTTNPRLVRVVSDTTLTAEFHKLQLIDEVDASVVMTLTPNPASGRVDCVLSAYPGPGARLIFTDASGKVEIDLPLVDERQSIDISHLSQGVYFVTLTSPRGSSTSKLVVTAAK